MLPKIWIYLTLVLVLNISLCHMKPYHSFIAHTNTRQRRNTIDCYPGAVPEEQGMKVFLTVSSLAKTSKQSNVSTQRQLELNWYNSEPMVGDSVGLYDHDPTINSSGPLVEIAPATLKAKFYRTTIEFPRPNLRNMTLERRCLGFWIGYKRQGHVIAANCLRMEPNWMWDNRDIFGPIKVIDMLIPGAHDAGSYAPYKGAESDNIFYRWILTQEEDPFSQAVYGIRHFDLRVAYYSETPEKFWLNHDIFRVNPFKNFVDDVKAFVNATNEILFLDFHQFPVGFKNRPERHLELMNYLSQELGEYLVPPSVGYEVTMETIWRSGKKIILAYNDDATSNGFGLWNEIPQLWANTVDINYLKVFIDTHMHSGRSDIWSAQLEFTPSAFDIFSTSSLRDYADRVNRNVTEWCRDLWWDEANLVAVDYFMGTNIIEVSIDANRKRRMCIDFMIRIKNQPGWIRGLIN